MIGPDQPGMAGSGARLSPWLLLFLAAAAPAVFALATDNIWEDFFITYRCSLNLVHGDGLVYEAGRRVHAFTSPLGVLLPAGISWLLHTDDPLRVMDLFRLCGCLAVAGAWALATGRLPGRPAVALAGGLWLLDPKLAAYATNGMETGLLVFFVILLWRALLDGRPGLAGLALGGLMWTRPDGFVYAGALAAATWIFRGPERRMRWTGWLQIAAIGGVIYVPWFVWAWHYYGSPVPNTILAKGGLAFNAETLTMVATYPWRFVFGYTAGYGAFLPPYVFVGGWPEKLWWLGKILAWGAVAAALWPKCARATRIAGLAFFLGGIYLEVTPRAPWYFPAWSVLAYVALAGVAAAGLEALRAQPVWRAAAAALLVAVGVAQGLMFVAVSVQLREQQRLIEWGLRAPLGRDLARATGGNKATVFLEPLGYIGYFSGLSMRDTPGLCAPEVSAIRRAGQTRMAGMIATLRPDWAVLRAAEFQGFTADEHRGFERDYRLWAQYDVRDQVNAVAWFPGRDLALYDAYFTVWHRQPAPESPRP